MEDLRLLATIEIKDEPRIRDTDLADRLGFERPRKIRELIFRNKDELLRYGSLPYEKAEVVSPHRGAKFTRGRGRPAMVCMLNEGQALLVCMFSQTEKAAAVRKLVIDTFMDYRAGKTVHVREHMRRPPLRVPPFYAEATHGFRLVGFANGSYPYIEGRMPMPLALELYALYGERIGALTADH